MRCLLPILMVSLTVHPCHAWSACGHHIIALLAYDLLSSAEREEVLHLLQAHPRFTEDFEVPQNVDTPDKRPHWLIGRAGYWPDVARRVPEFNRPTWHYQLGSSLTIGQNVRIPETPGALPADATMESRDLHITQAIELCRRVLQDGSQPAPDRAVALCWLAHLVADAHQPCPAGSLYAEGIFPEGDRGANSIPTKQGRNLHALWDGLLGDRYNAGDVARRSSEIKGDRQTWAAAAAAGTTLEPLNWLAESPYRIARIIPCHSLKPTSGQSFGCRSGYLGPRC